MANVRTLNGEPAETPPRASDQRPTGLGGCGASMRTVTELQDELRSIKVAMQAHLVASPVSSVAGYAYQS